MNDIQVLAGDIDPLEEIKVAAKAGNLAIFDMIIRKTCPLQTIFENMVDGGNVIYLAFMSDRTEIINYIFVNVSFKIKIELKIFKAFKEECGIIGNNKKLIFLTISSVV